MKQKKELRKLTSQVPVEVDEGVEGKVIIGKIPYNQVSQRNFFLIYGYNEVITVSAFNKTIADGSNVYALVNHAEDRVLGSTKSGNFVLTQSPEALVCTLTLPDSDDAEYVYEMVKKGICPTMSFGFIEYNFDSKFDENNIETRYLTEVRPYEISFAVPLAVYLGTSTETRKVRGIDLDVLSDALENNNILVIRESIDSLNKLLPSPKAESVNTESVKDNSAVQVLSTLLEGIKAMNN